MKSRMAYMFTMVVVLSLAAACKMSHPIVQYDSKGITFSGMTANLVIEMIPDGFSKDGITITVGHGSEMIIHYSDSSIIYVCEDVSYSPNRDNIYGLGTKEALWRNEFRFLAALAPLPYEEYYLMKKNPRCNCTNKELLEYKMPEVVDLYGNNGRVVWRDVFVNDCCFGYILFDSSRLNQFNQCIETIISNSKAQSDRANDL